MANGSSLKSMDSEFGRVTIKTLTRESGRTTKPMVTECMSGPTVTSTKESGSNPLSMVRALINSKTRTSTRGSMKWDFPTDKVFINGSLAHHILANS